MLAAAAVAQQNDACANATQVTGLTYANTVNTASASFDPVDPLSCAPPYRSVWYRYTAPISGKLVVDTIGSNYDTVLSAYTGSCGAFTMVPNACNDDTVNLQSRIIIDATAGTTYYLLVTGLQGNGGALKFNLGMHTPITVTSTSDAVDAAPNNGVCATAGGVCTLRAAIQEANARSGPDDILLPAGTYSLSLVGAGENASASGDLDITDDVTITGSGASATFIDATALADRVFDVRSAVATAVMEQLTVRNATVSGAGGGINNAGSLTLKNCVVTGNRAGGSGTDGGGINSSGFLYLSGSSVVGNFASGDGGGVASSGGVRLLNSTVADNRTTGNGASGGGLNLTGNNPSDIRNSTISGNLTNSNGGGIRTSGGTLSIVNSTISGNSANVDGAGILNAGAAVYLGNATVTGNTADADGNGSGDGGGLRRNSGTFQVENSVVAANTDTGGQAPDCLSSAAGVVSLGYNLIGRDTGCNWSATTGDRVGSGASPINPQLGPLQNNGGPTLTHAVSLASAAVNGGNPGGCMDNSGQLLTVDQRGEARPSNCDIGAYELQGLPTPSPTASATRTPTSPPPLNDSCSDAIAASASFTHIADTRHATVAIDDPVPQCSSSSRYRSVWYRYTAPVDGTVTADTFGSDYDTVLSAFTGSCGSYVPVAGACNDQAGGSQSQIAFEARAGTTYYIMATAWTASDTTNLVFNLTFGTPPANDECENAALIDTTPYSTTVTARSATTSESDPQLACAPGQTRKTVWYKVTPPINGLFEVFAAGGSFSTALGAYTGSCGSLSPKLGACDSAGPDSHIAFLGLANTTYYVLVAAPDNVAGPLGVSLTFRPIFEVNSTVDAVDSNPGNGVCLTAGNVCTLRAAVQEANARPGTNGVLLPPGVYNLTRTGAGENSAATGDVDVTDGIVIGGAGPGDTIIDGFSLGDRIFEIRGSGTRAQLERLTIRNAAAAVDGAGINNGGVLSLAECALSGNNAVGSGRDGGAIFNSGTMLMLRCSVANNFASGNGGGIAATGGIEIDASSISGNAATGANTDGAGINLIGTAVSRITNSTIDGNSATRHGGGIHCGGNHGLLMVNSTISGNQAGVDGGGIYANTSTNGVGYFTGINLTVTNNTADSDSNGSGDGGGVRAATQYTGGFVASIIAGNTDKGGQAPDCAAVPGGIVSSGYNLVGNTSNCNWTSNGQEQLGNAANPVNALLGPLAENGGPTLTHATTLLSPAVDAGGTAGCPRMGTQSIRTDQRGEPRILPCDVGAYELQGVPTRTPSPTATATGTATPTRTGTPTPTSPPPSNDACTGARPVDSLPFSSTVNAGGAGTDASDPTPGCGYGRRNRSVWYRFLAPSYGTLSIDTLGSSYDTVLSVYTGNCGALAALPEACSDDAQESTQARLTMTVNAGTTYYLMVTSFGTSAGRLAFNVNFDPRTTPTATPTGGATRTPTSTTPTPTALPNVWISHGPEGGEVKALALDPSAQSTIYASVGSAGMFKSTDDGATWQPVASAPGVPIALAVAPSGTVHLSNGNQVARSVNGGISWSFASIGNGNAVYVSALALDPSTPTTLYAGDYYRGVYKSTNGGLTWTLANGGLPSGSWVYAVKVDPSVASTVYAATSSGLFKSTDAGSNWGLASAGLPSDGANVAGLAIVATTPSTLYAAAFGAVYKSTDAGEVWSVATTGLPFTNYTTLAAAPLPGSSLLVGSSEQGVFRSTNGAANWTASSNGLGSLSITTIVPHPSAATTLYAGTSDGVYKSTDGGSTWSARTSGLRGVSASGLVAVASSPTTLYASTSGNGIYKGLKGGEIWAPSRTGLPINADVRALGIHPSNPSTLYAATYPGVFKSIDSADSWQQAGNLSQSHTSLAVDPSNPTTLYSGSGAGLLKSSDGGASWYLAGAGLPESSVAHVVAVHPTISSTVYALVNQTLYRSTNAGSDWARIQAPILAGASLTALAVSAAAPDTLYAAGYPGVFRSLDAGSSWQAISAGLLASQYTAVATDPTTPGVLYAGTYGAVYRTANDGDNWALVGSGLPDAFIQALLVDPGSSQTVYAGTQQGVFAVHQVQLPTPTPTPTSPPPANDSCGAATNITTEVFFDALNASSSSTDAGDPIPNCGSSRPSHSVWYKFTAPGYGTVSANTFGSDYDTVVSAYTGTCGAFSLAGCNDDYSGANSLLTFTANSGATYYLLVTSFNPGAGQLAFSLNFELLSTPTTTGTPTRTPTATLTRTPRPTATACLTPCAQPICGNGSIEFGEDCDDGGLCIGGLDAGSICSAEDDCRGDGMCTGGPHRYAACASDLDCPQAACRRCIPQGGDACAANCSFETEVSYPIATNESATQLISEFLRVPLQFAKACKGGANANGSCGTDAGCPGGTFSSPHQRLTIGREIDGKIPFVMKSATVAPQPFLLYQVACVCQLASVAKTCGGTLLEADGMTLSTNCTAGVTAGDSVCSSLGKPPCTFVHGPGNSAAGEIGCEGVAQADVSLLLDSSRPDGLPTVSWSGDGQAGTATGTASVSLRVGPDNCLGTPALNGADGVFCTEDDAIAAGTIFSSGPMTTGLARATVLNANGTSAQIGPEEVNGAPFNCGLLENGSAAGARLVQAVPGLDTPTLGDLVVTSEQHAGLPSPSRTPTPTQSATVTASPTPTSTPHATGSPTRTPTALPTATRTATTTYTALPTPTPTSSRAFTPKPTATSTATNSATPAATATNSPTSTPTSSPSHTAPPTATPSQSPPATPSRTPTATAQPTATPTYSPPATDTPTPTPTVTPTSTSTVTYTWTPTARPTATEPPTQAPTAAASHTPHQIPSPTPAPSASATASPVPTVSASPTSTPTAAAPGDGNCDGAASAADLTSIVRQMSARQCAGADANNDGHVDEEDVATAVAQIFAR